MFTTTINYATHRQSLDVERLGHLHPDGIEGLRKQVAEATCIDQSIDRDAMIDVIEINKMVPRGLDIEWMVMPCKE